jgi:NAD(P)H-dependent flavin oxidoreductase YrpB (nitropropane dioxygenase family)
MGEDEGCTGDAANFAGAGGDVLEGAPAAGEQGKPAFAQAAQGALDGVAGTGIEVRLPAAGGIFDGNQDADARPGSAKVSRPVAAAW